MWVKRAGAHVSVQEFVKTSYDLMSVCVRVQSSVWPLCLLILFVSQVEVEGQAHLEADLALLAADAGQHEEDEGEEAREGDGHHSQGR